MSLCWCRERESFFTDKVTLREYCQECSKSVKTSSENVFMQYLDSITPFGEGDVVECYQAGDPDRYDGTGLVLKVSRDYREGGTPVYPVFHVRLKGGREKWYTSICLKRVH